MQGSRTRRITTLWIAALAVLVATLAPTLAHAFGAPGAPAWSLVCTEQGSRWVAASGGEALQGPAGGAMAHGLEHCPYCSLHLPAFGLPPATQAVPRAPQGQEALPQAAPATPRPAVAWTRALPRAPPARA